MKKAPAKPKEAKLVPKLAVERKALKRWFEEEADVIALRTFRDSEVGRRVFAVLYASVPSGFPLRGAPVTDTQSAIELGRINGHIGAVHLLEAMCEFPEEQPDHEEPDFGADRILEQELYGNRTTD